MTSGVPVPVDGITAFRRYDVTINMRRVSE